MKSVNYFNAQKRNNDKKCQMYLFKVCLDVCMCIGEDYWGVCVCTENATDLFIYICDNHLKLLFDCLHNVCHMGKNKKIFIFSVLLWVKITFYNKSYREKI